MESLIEMLASQQCWEEFLAHRLRKGRFSWREFDEADLFVEGEGYLPLARKILAGGSLEPPCRRKVNKMGSDRKRVVYSYGPEEMAYLKALSFLLYKYDASFASNCYAFRRGIRATDAVLKVNKAVRGRSMWAYKADIHDYFNSIPIPKLLPLLRDILSDDPLLYSFFERMLSDDRVVSDGEIISESHGVMAGVPTAPFLADVCLSAMEHWFEERGAVYARYSDDIIVFAEDEATLRAYRDKILEFISSLSLEINPSKEKVYSPGEPYEFLGFKCLDETIDISDAALEKMKEEAQGHLRRGSRRPYDPLFQQEILRHRPRLRRPHPHMGTLVFPCHHDLRRPRLNRPLPPAVPPHRLFRPPQNHRPPHSVLHPPQPRLSSSRSRILRISR